MAGSLSVVCKINWYRVKELELLFFYLPFETSKGEKLAIFDKFLVLQSRAQVNYPLTRSRNDLGLEIAFS